MSWLRVESAHECPINPMAIVKNLSAENAEYAESAEVRRGDLAAVLCGSQRSLRLCAKVIRAPFMQLERLQ